MPSPGAAELVARKALPLLKEVAGTLSDTAASVVASTEQALAGRAAQESAAEKLSNEAGALLSNGSAQTEAGVRSQFLSDETATMLLPQRRFFRKSMPDQDLEARPYRHDWEMRKEELTEFIAKKINSQHVSEADLSAVIQTYVPDERPYVARLLAGAASNTTDRGLMQSLRSVMNQINDRYPDRGSPWSSIVNQFNDSYPHSGTLWVESPPNVHFIATTPSSSGNMLAYLARKTVNGEHPIFHLDRLDQLLTGRFKGLPLATFDDIAGMTDKQKAALIKIQQHRPLIVIDLNAFDRAPNVVDFALGPHAVDAKLRPLLSSARELGASGLPVEQAATQAALRPADQAFAQLVSQLPDGGHGITLLRPEPISARTALAPPVDANQIQAFFEREFKTHDKRIASAELLAENTDIYSIGRLVAEMPYLKNAIVKSAERRGIDADRDLFVVGTQLNMEFEGAASSEAFITHLYARANGVSADRVMTKRGLERLLNTGQLEKHRVVALDDATYSGEHAKIILGQTALGKTGFNHFPDLAFANFTSMSDFASFASEGDFGVVKSRPREFIHLRTHFSAATSRDPLVLSRTKEEFRLMSEMTDSNSFDGVTSLQVFPHMTADSTMPWLAGFANDVLKVRCARSTLHHLEDPWS